MKQKEEIQLKQVPSKKINNFFQSLSNHLKQSNDRLFVEIKDSLSNKKQINVKENSSKENLTKKPVNKENKSEKKSVELKSSQKKRNQKQKNNKKTLEIGTFLSSIKEKQKSAYTELIQDLENLQNQSFSASKKSQKNKNQNPESTKISIKPRNQKGVKQQSALVIEQDFQKQPSSLKQVEQFCDSLKQEYNQKIYNKDWVAEFIYNLEQIQANNTYLCVQQAFEILKRNQNPNYSLNNKKTNTKNNNSSSKINNSDTIEFNLQLTIKSRNSKNSFNFDPKDSLTYSNATTFGLQSTQTKSKPLNNKHQNSSKNLSSNQQVSLKTVQSKDQGQTDIAHIRRAQSRGEVSRQNSRQPTPNIMKPSEKSQKLLFQENQAKHTDNHKKNINENGKQKQKNKKNIKDNKKEKNIDQRKKSKKKEKQRKQQCSSSSSSSSSKSTSSDKKSDKQQQKQAIYSLLPLTLQENINSNKKSVQNEKGQETSRSNIKKSFSIKSYSNKLKLSQSNSASKKITDQSVFGKQISQFQDRISRIKEAKLAKKLQLQEQLKRINNQIQELKVESPQKTNKQQAAKRLSTSKPKSRQNTLQSRIQINDDVQQKKQAQNLVRNLKAQKISRQNQKRKKYQVLNTDLHQQIQDIMRLKYFNQQRVKQKKKLQIIQRMKQQQMRKIQEQKKKQESLQFLSKLKAVERQNLIKESQKRQKNIHISSSKKQNQQYYQKSPKPAQNYKDNHYRDPEKQSPNNLSRNKQQIIPETPILKKRKQYLSKRRNLNFGKKPVQNKYQQVLG